MKTERKPRQPLMRSGPGTMTVGATLTTCWIMSKATQGSDPPSKNVSQCQTHLMASASPQSEVGAGGVPWSPYCSTWCPFLEMAGDP